MKKQLIIICSLIFLLVFAFGCDDPESEGCDGSAPGSSADDDDIASGGATSLYIPEDDDDDSSGDDDDDTGPGILISDLAVYKDPQNPLLAWVVFTTDVQAQSEATVIEAGGEGWRVSKTGYTGTVHLLPLLGLVQETEYEIGVRVWDGSKSTGRAGPVTYTTGSLPADIPDVVVDTIDPALMEPGYTMFNLIRWGYILPGTFSGILLAVDPKGRLCWYHSNSWVINGSANPGQGEIIFWIYHYAIRKINTLGKIEFNWWVNNLGLETIHHEVVELPSGNYLTLSTQMRSISGYQLPFGGTATYKVVGDIVVELDPAGTILREWNMFDYLDPYRIREDFHDVFWFQHIPYWNSKDWNHSNAIIVDPVDGGMLISIRNQDWIIKIDPDSGDLLWKMGFEGDFELTAGEWFFHQHAPKILSNGRLLVYDNGNARESYENGEEPWSRIVEYEYDETAMTARQTWEYRGDSPYYSPVLGDVDEMDNGNILITDGGMVENPLGPTYLWLNQKSARILEITREPAPRKVFEIHIDNDSSDSLGGYSIYRANRVPTLYPTEYTVTKISR